MEVIEGRGSSLVELMALQRLDVDFKVQHHSDVLAFLSVGCF